MINDLRSLDDDLPDTTQAETPNRKELFATSASGQVHKIIVIREAGAWRIQRTDLEP